MVAPDPTVVNVRSVESLAHRAVERWTDHGAADGPGDTAVDLCDYGSPSGSVVTTPGGAGTPGSSTRSGQVVAM